MISPTGITFVLGALWCLKNVQDAGRDAKTMTLWKSNLFTAHTVNSYTVIFLHRTED